MKPRFILWTLCLVLPLASCTPTNTFDENANQTAPSTDASNDEPGAPAENAKTDNSTASDDAIPPVPENGTLKEYKEYIANLNKTLDQKAQSMVVKAQTDGVNPQSEDFINSMKEMGNEYFSRIEKATDKALLLKNLSDEEFEELAGGKVQLIMLSAKLNNENEDAINAKMQAFADQLRSIDKAKYADDLEAKIFQNKVLGYIMNGDVKEFSKVADDIDAKVEKAGKDITPALAQQAMLIVMASRELQDYEAPEDRLDKYSKVFAEASNPDVNKLTDVLERAILIADGEKRFRESLGNEFKFGGTFIDGSEYKAEDYAGKVVLIDFWATWCGPCCAELPNVKKMYDAYHDKGFEVIGVTMDDSDKEEEFKAFLKENKIPWKQMFDKKAVVPDQLTKSGKPVLVSFYYGISGIPCPVLIGKDGKVLSLNARGEELEKLLAKIFSEAKPEEPTVEEAKPEEPTVEEAKPEEPAVEEAKPEEPAVEEAKPEEPTVEEANPEEPTVEEAKPEEPAVEEAKPEEAK